MAARIAVALTVAMMVLALPLVVVAVVAPVAGAVTVVVMAAAPGVIPLWFAAAHVAGNASACGTPQTCTHYRARTSPYRLPHCGACCAANCSTEHGAVLVTSMVGDGCARRSTQGATNHRTIFATYALAQHGACCGTHTATQERREVICVDYRCG